MKLKTSRTFSIDMKTIEMLEEIARFHELSLSAINRICIKETYGRWKEGMDRNVFFSQPENTTKTQ